MAKAVFTSEQVEQFSLPQTRCGVAPLPTELARLAKHLFVGNSPRNRGYRYGQNEEPQDLRDHVTPRL